MAVTELVDLKTISERELQRRWEAAYLRFETPEMEISKFRSRLDRLGVGGWDRGSEIVEIFCGRGNGLRALESLGFTRLAGVDLSEELIAEYDGPARMFVEDCRQLPFSDHSTDIVVVQGGLHHLQQLPDDLNTVLDEVCRVLRPSGRLVLVEPWLTPFLRAVHFASRRRTLKRLYPRLDALAVMVHYEAPTYFNWLDSPSLILESLRSRFEVSLLKRQFGKLYFVGSPKRPLSSFIASRNDLNPI